MNKLGKLSEALSAFWNREGNRILFANHKTLNQTAWDMWETEGGQGVDSSVLSRVISGERLFTPFQLNAFIRLLRIHKKPAQTLRLALEEDILQKYDIKLDDLQTFKPDMDFYRSLVSLSQDLRRSNLSWKSINLCGFLVKALDDLPIINPDLLKIKAASLYEMAQGICEVYSVKQLNQVLPSISGKMYEIGQKLNDPYFMGVAHNLLGNKYYFNGRYDLALQQFYLGKEYFLTNSEEKSVNLRGIMGCLAFNRQEPEFETVSDYVYKNLSHFDEAYYYPIYLASVRSYIYIKNFKKAEELLKVAEKFLFDNLLPNKIQTQLNLIKYRRAQLELITHSQSKILRRDFDSMKFQTMNLTREFSSIRYQKIIEFMEPVF